MKFIQSTNRYNPMFSGDVTSLFTKARFTDHNVARSMMGWLYLSCPTDFCENSKGNFIDVKPSPILMEILKQAIPFELHPAYLDDTLYLSIVRREADDVNKHRWFLYVNFQHISGAYNLIEFEESALVNFLNN